MARYDRIGRNDATRRRPDPDLAARIARALGEAQMVVNVGAGAGSYESEDRVVIAVEPPRRATIDRRASLTKSVVPGVFG